MSDWFAIAAVLAVSVATLAVGAVGLRISRTTSDFYVASRTVGSVVNASAISGEYLSAASFLGVAGLVLLRGVDMLWYPVGWTAGYLLLLVFVAAPLRRSRAYTLPDFAEFRLESIVTRRLSSALVVLIGLLYLVPQFQGAGLTLRALTDAPTWTGELVVAVVVLANVAAGGMRSITIAQAFQYWLKLWALLLPLALLLLHWRGDGSPGPRLDASDWVEPMQGHYATYLTYSLILATFLGTMGLPHVVVRFYTNRDGRAARRTTLSVLTMLSAFYLLPTLYGVLGRIYTPDLIASGHTDSVVLELPGRLLGGVGGDLLTALLGAGAFAAFLSTSSGLVVSVGGVIGQDLLGRRLDGVTAFRVAATGAALAALVLTVLTSGLAVAHAVELAFAVAASTFCPLLLLGIWWRGLTAPGAIAGLLVGGISSSTAVLAVMLGAAPTGLFGAVVSQPALCTVPVAFATMVVGSLLTKGHLPAHLGRTMVRLHTPEEIVLDRGSYHPERRSGDTSGTTVARSS
ncbi:sodium/solute symporter [Nocardioides terrisoli]|uniref:sodium/solute symporter n=1 Tax=Nocardioides terrisoli TaxID=3388267 RepID=UPI00287BAD0F|nr:cation acetate symporter [Nocardioides marmorisolisilvae]